MKALAQVWLPFPPSVNNLFPTRMIRGRIMRVPSKQYKAWRKSADVLLMASRIRCFEMPVHILLELTPRDARARDADNYPKPILDALVRCRILHDDSNKWVNATTPRWHPASRLDAGVVVQFYEANVANPTLPGLFDASSFKEAV